ncbi:cupin domain-containing protein [candidate division WWE3 bacterium CG_4_10_14_0_2_um_filter_42_7]|uniref:Cupin domain-containing protein n=2 Tax=Katanobacteria TaxID=422282 RepID=A0A2H0XAA9_UNCKA|nr:MAG: cupin domain-containing protein [candidate division WWE3 bacterium CG08_land_8_20_14_0_20_41_15]PIZ43554.1 MAG: cupin domain-containing protein [candidate division WWE3 bacterium CG_4_10_14_0_2_um_filter_42_7]
MSEFVGNIEELTLAGENFREVLFTGSHLQLVLMSLLPNEDIGVETHSNVDQFFRFESGEGKVVINGKEYLVKDGSAVVVPAGSEHNIINTSAELPLKIYTIYSPANHPAGKIHKTREEAMADEHDHV